MTELDPPSDLTPAFASLRERASDTLAQQIRARARARVAGRVEPGLNLAGYLDPEPIGRGAMGIVYRARDPELNRNVAIKLVRQTRDASADRRLRREAQNMARVEHPNVVHIYEAGRLDDGQVFLVMQYVDGEDLRTWGAARPRTWQDLLSVYCQAGRGLEAVHAAQLAHRDFKPENVLIDAKGHARVTDFGLADVLHTDGSDAARTAGGTFLYAAPECLEGDAGDARSDQFSFCVALYEALLVHPFVRPEDIPRTAAATSSGRTGMATYTHAYAEELQRRIKAGAIASAPPTRKLPERVLQALRRGLAWNPDGRFLDMKQLLVALEHDPWPRRRNALVIGGLCVGLAGALLWPRAAETTCAADAALTPWLAGEAAEGVRVAIAGTDAGTAAAAAAHAARVSGAMNDYAATLAREQVALCTARRASLLEPAVLDGQGRCLADAQRRFTMIERQLTAAAPAPIERAFDLLAALPTPGDCRLEDKPACQAIGPGGPDTPVQQRLTAAWTYELAGDYKQAVSAAQEAVTHADAAGAPGPAMAARLHVGRLYDEQKRSDAATAAFEAVRTAAIRHDCPARAVDALGGLARLGALHPGIDRGRAAAWSEAAEDFAARLDDPARVAAAANARGLLLLLRFDDHAGARRLLEQALAIRSGAKTELERLDLSRTLLNLGTAAALAGDPTAARRFLESSRTLVRETFGPEHPANIRAEYNAGLDALDAGEPAAARESLARAETLARRGHASEGFLARILLARATTEMRLRNSAESVALAQAAWGLADAALAPEDPVRLEILLGLAGTHEAAGELDAAREVLRRAFDDVPALRPTRAAQAEMWMRRAELENLAGRHEDARAAADRGLALFHESPEDRDPGLEPFLDAALGETLFALGRVDETVAPLRRALAGWGASGPGERTARVQWALARALRATATGEACKHASAAATRYAAIAEPAAHAVSTAIREFLADHRCPPAPAEPEDP